MTRRLTVPNMRIALSTAGPSWHSSFHLVSPARLAIPRARTLHYSAASVSRPSPLNKDPVYRRPAPLQPHSRTATLLPRPRATHSFYKTQQTHYSTQAASSATEPTIHGVFEKFTGTWQYVVADPTTLKAVIIDPVLDYDPATQTISTRSADELVDLVQKHQYDVIMVLETHAHADHITAASYLQRCLAQEQGHAPLIGIGKRIGQVQETFGKRYGVPPEEYRDVYDILFEDDASFQIGNLTGTAIHLPGHTPDHLGYHIGDNVFCGDSLFHADLGTARCDFPGGSAVNLYRSGRKLLDLGDHVKIWTGHDYPPAGRDQPVPWMSVQSHKQSNTHIKDGITEEDFVGMRTARDAQLEAPRLLHPSLQINIRAGRLPRPSASGYRMLHLPLKINSIEW